MDKTEVKAHEEIRRLKGLLKRQSAEFEAAKAAFESERSVWRAITSEKAKIEADFRRSEARYAEAFVNSPVALLETDVSACLAYMQDLRNSGIEDLAKHAEEHPEAVRECMGRMRFTAANKAALDLYKAVSLEVLQEGFPIFVERAAQEYLVADFLALAEGKARAEREGVHWTTEGKPLVVNSRWSRLVGSDPADMRLLFCDIDVTAKKEAEEAVREKTEEFNTFFDVALDLLCIADTSGTFRKVNVTWEKTLGYAIDELEGKSFLGFVHPDDIPGTLQAIEQLSSRKEVTGFTNRYRCRDGSYRWIEWRSFPAGDLIYAAARDMTERLAVEEALREREGAYRALFDDSPAGLIEVDTSQPVAYIEGLRESGVRDFALYFDDHPEIGRECYSRFRFLRINKAALDMYGVEDLDGFASGATRYLRETPPAVFKEGFLTLAEKRRGYEREQTRVRRDGSTISVHSKWTVLSGYEQTYGRMIFCDQDITERKKAEEDLRGKAAFLEAVVNSSLDGILVNDNVWNNLFVNRRTAELWKVPQRIVDEGDQEEWRRHVDSMVKDRERFARQITYFRDHPDETLHDELELVDGTVLERYSSAALGKDGRHYGMVWAFRDITERKLAERAIAESEERFRTAIENSNDGVAIISGQKHLYVNRRWLEIFGYDSPDEVVGRAAPIMVLHPDDRDVVRSYREARARGEEAPTRYAFRAIKKSGEVVHVDTSISPGSYHGEPVFFSFVRDISALRQGEEELRKARDAAEQAARAKSEFLANMSHEMRTPMNAVVGLTRLALKTDPLPQLRDYLTKIDSSARILLGIINNVLDFSKIEARKLTINVTGFHLGKLMKEVTDIFAFEAEGKGLRLVTRAAPDVPEVVVGDPLRVSQVLVNLLGNAVKFTDSGTITVTADTLEREEGKAVLHLSVRDTGIGMSQKQKEKLFQPFTQIDSSTTRRHGGTGLGLSISRELVRLMGGEIAVESAPGEGSIFSFTVPVGYADDPAAATALTHRVGRVRDEEDWESSHRLAGARVLLVEDNAINMQVAREILEGFGLAVEEAEGGGKAIETLEKGASSLDAVLLDIQMPDVDGYEVARTIRNRLALLSLPIIAMTAHVGDDERRRCLDAGMNDHVEKPIEPRKLMTTLSRWVAPHEGGSFRANARGDAGDREKSKRKISLPGIDVEAGITRLAGNRALYTKLFMRFCREHRDAVDAIKTAVASGDMEGARRMAHTLKGTSGNLAAFGVHQAAAAVEKALGEDRGPRLDPALDELARALALVVALEGVFAVAPEDGTDGKARVAAEKDEDSGELLRNLYVLLVKRNLKGRHAFARLKARLTGEDFRENLRLCEGALGRLDYAEAMEQVEAIARRLGVGLHEGR
jgi:PAS domain S-box-containing protein